MSLLGKLHCQQGGRKRGGATLNKEGVLRLVRVGHRVGDEESRRERGQSGASGTKEAQ